MEDPHTLAATTSRICRELENVFISAQSSGLDPKQRIVEEILKTATSGGHVVVHGVGREGLMMKGFAMRLFHLGLKSACVGEMTAPPVGPADLLIASAGPGGFGSVDAVISRAKNDGARVLLVTAMSQGSAARLADVVTVIPAQTMAHDGASIPAQTMAHDGASIPAQTMAHDGAGTGKVCASILPMGSLYEGSLFLLFEMVVLDLANALNQTADSMTFRHTNLE